MNVMLCHAPCHVCVLMSFDFFYDREVLINGESSPVVTTVDTPTSSANSSVPAETNEQQTDE